MTATDGNTGKTAPLLSLSVGCVLQRQMEKVRQLTELSRQTHLSPEDRKNFRSLAEKNELRLRLFKNLLAGLV